MKKDLYNETDACLELLARLHLVGDIEEIDYDLKKDIVESFKNTGYLKIYILDNRPIINYEDDDSNIFMWGDSYRDLNDQEYEKLSLELNL